MSHPLRWRPLAGLLLCAGLLMPVASAQAQTDQQPKLLLEEATKKELVDGDLKGAIDTYQKILALAGVPRATSARALLRLGQCYEKLGNTEARNAYERIVRDFGDQPEEANVARARLAALGGHDTAMRVRQVWTSWAGDLLGAITRDGRYLPLQDWDSQDLAVRDLVTGQLRKLTNKDPKSLEFALLSVPSPDGKTLAYAWYNASESVDLRTVGLDGSNARVLWADAAIPEALPFDWSPDGKHVLAAFYRRGKGSQLVLVSVPDGAVRVLKDFETGGLKRARFSPDGRFVAYDRPQQPGSTKYDVFVLALGDGRDALVVGHMANDVLFDWTPDGGRLLFGSDRSGAMAAWWIAVKDGQTAGPAELVKADVGPDARPLGFTRDGSYYYHVRTGMSDVHVAEVDFASGRLVVPPSLATQRYAGSNSAPDWSSDGRKLVFLSRRGPGTGWGVRAICVRDTESGEVSEVPSKLQIVSGVRWAPDGRSLLATAQGPNGVPGVFRIDTQTGEFTPVDLVRPAPISRANWSADGKTFFYQQWGTAKTSNVVARTVATGQEQILYSVTQPSVFVAGATLSPDGQRLAFVVLDGTSGARLLKVLPAGGGEVRDVLPGRSLPWPVSIGWAPDSQGVLFTKQPKAGDRQFELWLAPIQGGEPRRLDLMATDMRELRVHPDGRHLAFTSGGDRSEVWVMENFLRPAK
jgi:Tol biopolymer transport system component